jgi:hypothetical protein
MFDHRVTDLDSCQLNAVPLKALPSQLTFFQWIQVSEVKRLKQHSRREITGLEADISFFYESK